jgi:hypothetical protein
VVAGAPGVLAADPFAVRGAPRVPARGIIAVPTVILLTDRQAVVVQASTTHLCGDRIDVHPLCADPRGTLGAIARRVLAAFP